MARESRADRRERRDLEAAQAAETFEIRRRSGLYLVAALVPLLLAAGFGVLAVLESQPLLWIPVGVLLVLSLVAGSGLHDARTPLFVADDHGVRLRDGNVWVGLLWTEMADVRVEGRSGGRDARVKVVGPDGARVYVSQAGFTTTASADDVREQLARRRGPAPY